jgi:hypothetical protein
MLTICGTNNIVNELQQKNIDPNIVPTVELTFKDIDDAYKFYKSYAYEVGFPLTEFREKTFSKWINCSREGKSAPKPNDTPRMRNRNSGRTQCKAGIKLKKYMMMKKNVVAAKIELVNLEHNHEFITDESEKQHLRCNKSQDAEFINFVDAMHDSRVPQHCIVDFISDMHDGSENVPVIVQDLKTCKESFVLTMYILSAIDITIVNVWMVIFVQQL